MSATNQVEPALTNLLTSTKVLLDTLISANDYNDNDNDRGLEGHISDLYVRFGDDFNDTVKAFEDPRVHIDMSHLKSVPEDLRKVLEEWLSESDAGSKESMERYVPDARRVITGLLQGLQGKQTLYRKVVS